jgi:hypothetical protein
MTYYTDPASKAGVIDTGTVNWIYAMTYCQPNAPGCAAGTIQQITGNILRLFGQGPAGARAPAISNWKTITPAGS